jgi:hypothetical protein
MVVEVPEPVEVTVPGDLVIVHEPDGRPLKATLPVEVAHEGWVMVPTCGCDGTALTDNS